MCAWWTKAGPTGLEMREELIIIIIINTLYYEPGASQKGSPEARMKLFQYLQVTFYHQMTPDT